MPETYSLILNSQNTTNVVNNSSLSAYQYNINWGAILPRKYDKYSVTYQLKSVNVQTSVITGTSASTVLTVTSVTGATLTINSQFIQGTTIQTITAFGTGTGGNGTYTISPGFTNATPSLYFGILNTSYIQNIMCSVNFGYNTTYEQNNNPSSVLGCVYPYTYPLSNTGNISIFNYNCTVMDNGPIQIGYPSNNVITVRFLQMNGTSAFTLMPNYQLQLYFEPIKE